MSVLAAACGGSTSTSVTAPSSNSARCQPSFDATPRSFGASGGTSSVNVTVSRECSWSAASAAPWLAITSGAQGQGDGAVAFRLDSNPDPVSRSSAILIGDGRVEVSQQAGACRFDVSSPPAPVAAGGASFAIQVRTHAVCNWSVAIEAPWASATPLNGRGNGTVSVTVPPNAGAERSGFIVTAGERLQITQAGAATPPAPGPTPPAPAPTPPAPAPPPPAPTPTPTPTPPPQEEDVEFSGLVSALLGRCPDLRFTVDANVVITNHDTKFKGGKCGDIENGTRVRVKGRRSVTGIVTAREVELR
ncbi:MAG TPA: BACON domain-containing carbohydrate-binding protein [Vicinamibacterales bacterium]|nr:BACON domain-containing carbohydrate-binding protein [Vicinamibacterales bacterium]